MYVQRDKLVFNWDNEKNEALKKERGVSFEQIIIAIEEERLVDVLEHPNKKKFPNQVLLLINWDDYIHVVPTVINKDRGEYFFKIIYPSRKYTSKYIGDHKK